MFLELTRHSHVTYNITVDDFFKCILWLIEYHQL